MLDCLGINMKILNNISMKTTEFSECKKVLGIDEVINSG